MDGNQVLPTSLILGRLMGIAGMGQFDVEPTMDGADFHDDDEIAKNT
jgi:hypothetical protein